jgi:transcriptional regulator with XRE-family HTH domain
MKWKTVEDVPEKITSEPALIASQFKYARIYGSSYFGGVEKDKSKGFTQQEAADKFGISKSALTKLEAGDVTISLKHILKLCRILNIKIIDFFTEYDFMVNMVEKSGISLVEERLPVRFDYLAWENKVEVKAKALINKTVKAMKKDKTYYSLSQKEQVFLNLSLRHQAHDELKAVYPKDKAFEELIKMNKHYN